MGEFVIAAFRPKPGKERQLVQLLREHLPILRAQGLATERAALVLRAADGTLLEIFEWQSAAAVEAAHTNPVVRALWERFEALCDYEMLANLAEAKRLFPPFEPVDLER